MHQIWAVAKLTFRLPFRRGGGGLLVLLLGVGTTVFIFAVSQSDGVLVNEVALRTRYALHFALTVLSLALLWYACVSVRGDIDRKRLHLLTAYPLSRPAIYLGKWLGLTMFGALALGLILLTTALAATVLTWQWRAADEVAQVRHRWGRVVRECWPVPPQVGALVEDRLAALRREGNLPPERSEADVRAELEKLLRQQAQLVAPGGTKTWWFDLGHVPRHGDRVTLRFRYYARDKEQPVTGSWALGVPGAGSCRLLVTSRRPFETGQFAFPLHLIPEDGRFRIGFLGVDNPELVFYQQTGLRLYYDDGPVWRNLPRLVLPLLAHLAAVVAVGLTLGVPFTLSVAAFVAVVLYLVALAGPLFENVLREAEPRPGGAVPLVDRTAQLVVPVGLGLAAGLGRPAVIEPLSDGIIISADNLGLGGVRRLGAVLLYPVRIIADGLAAPAASGAPGPPPGTFSQWLRVNGGDLAAGLVGYLGLVAGLGIWLLQRKELDRVH